MTTDGGVDVDTATLGLKVDADEITHLVCCRDREWGVAFCTTCPTRSTWLPSTSAACASRRWSG